MANNMSRRVFLKCAGVAALAVTTSGIFAGCSGPSGGSGTDTVYDVNETVETNGVKVKLLGYQQGLLSEIAGNHSGQSLIAVCFNVENQSEQPIQMGNTTQDMIDRVWEAIKNYEFKELGKSEFKLAVNNQLIGHAAIGYNDMSSAGIGSALGAGFLGTLEPKKSGCIKVFAVVPNDWESLGIQYTPYFAKHVTYNFVLKKANKLN